MPCQMRASCPCPFAGHLGPDCPQNVDDLVRAGSHHVVLTLKSKAESTLNPKLVVEIEVGIGAGDANATGPAASEHRWFDEAVPMIDPAMPMESADIVVVVEHHCKSILRQAWWLCSSRCAHSCRRPQLSIGRWRRVELHRCGAVEGLTQLERRWRSECG